MAREVLSAGPVEGDYILSPTGFSWNVLRSNGNHGGSSVATGERDKKAAIAHVRRLAAAAGADGWETVGSGLFWRISHHRVPVPV